MSEYINTKAELFYGDRYFKSEVLPDGYRLGPNRKVASPYFASKGFFVSQAYSDYYSQLTGIKSDKYISMDLYYFYIIPCLNRREFVRAYADKNNYSLFFNGANQPETVIKNRNGIFYAADNKVIAAAEAITRCLDCAGEMIIKPTIETGEGRGVELLLKNSDSEVGAQFNRYAKDFIVQRKFVQHESMSALNASSLNTMRILTYRGLDGRVRHLKDKTFLRVGTPGAVRDNVGSGGGMCQVFDDGSVNDRVVHYKFMEVGSFRTLHGIDGFKIPNYAEALKFAEELHTRLPYFDFIGWDIAIDQDGQPAFVEFNVPCEVGATQQGCGPMFEEDLDEIMERVSKVKKIEVESRVNIFSPGFDHILQLAGPEYELR